MPLYEYQCEACGNRFEVIHKFSDPPADTCTKCGGAPVTRLPSTPAFQFKGSGWYITDYARKGQPSGESGSDAGGKKTDAKESGESKAAPAAGSETKTEKTSGPGKAKSSTPPTSGSG